MSITIRPAEVSDSGAVSALVLDLVDLFVSCPEAPEVGPFIESLSQHATSGRIGSREFDYFVAEDERGILGVIAVRSHTHIYHLFVHRDAHKRGVATALWNHVLAQSDNKAFTVNSSPFAVPVYERFGFMATDAPQEENGLVFVPMEYQHDS